VEGGRITAEPTDIYACKLTFPSLRSREVEMDDIETITALPNCNKEYKEFEALLGMEVKSTETIINLVKNKYFLFDDASFSFTTFADKNKAMDYEPSLSTVRILKKIIEIRLKGTTYGNTFVKETIKNDATFYIYEYASQITEKKCGNVWYDPKDENLKCDRSIILAKCGDGWYDKSDKKSNKRCQNNVLETKCGNDWYVEHEGNRPNSGMVMCIDNVLITECGRLRMKYRISDTNFRCKEDVLEHKCDGNWKSIEKSRGYGSKLGSGYFYYCYEN
jgi:hypothetical protein